MNSWYSMKDSKPPKSGWYHAKDITQRIIPCYYNSRTEKFYTDPEGRELKVTNYQLFGGHNEQR